MRPLLLGALKEASNTLLAGDYAWRLLPALLELRKPPIAAVGDYTHFAVQATYQLTVSHFT